MSACTLCTHPAKARGWCWAHYLRWKRHGDPIGKGQRRAHEPIEHGRYADYVSGCRCERCTDAMRLYRRDRAAAIQRGEAEVTHGKPSSYCSGCRCDQCRRGMATAARAKRATNYERFRRGLLDVEHGVFRTYSEFGCRCVFCSRAFRVKIREYDGRPRRNPRPRKLRTARVRPSRIGRAAKLAGVEIEARNHLLRQADLAAAVANAEGELANLIAEQQRDRFQRESFTFSLDAPDLLGRDRHEYIGDEWDDPTFEAVLMEAT